MKLNGDEKSIQQLFREMNLQDQRRAPQFAGVLEAASFRTARRHDRVWSLKLAVGVATMILVALVAVAVIRHGKTGPAEDPAQQASVEQAPSAPPSPDSIKPSQVGPVIPRRVPKQIRHRRTTIEPAIDLKSLFAWQSPTASLLKTPGEDLLMSLPRLGESLQSIKTFSPDLWN